MSLTRLSESPLFIFPWNPEGLVTALRSLVLGSEPGADPSPQFSDDANLRCVRCLPLPPPCHPRRTPAASELSALFQPGCSFSTNGTLQTRACTYTPAVTSCDLSRMCRVLPVFREPEHDSPRSRPPPPPPHLCPSHSGPTAFPPQGLCACSSRCLRCSLRRRVPGPPRLVRTTPEQPSPGPPHNQCPSSLFFLLPPRPWGAHHWRPLVTTCVAVESWLTSHRNTRCPVVTGSPCS